MIQTAFFFILGFLCAAFLALLVAPSIWRRAVALTRRRVEASLPLTMEEIKADKDGLRAEFAASARRLEMSVRSQKEKAAVQAIEIGRLREELALTKEQVEAKARAVAEMEARMAQAHAKMQAREEEAARLAERLAGQEKLVAERDLELEKLGGMYDEASFNASSRQIEIVAQEAKVDELSGDVAALRRERKEADGRVREKAAEIRTLRETLRAGQKKAAALEKKQEGLIASLSEREEKLERRERELARLRDQLRQREAAPAETGADAAADRTRLEDRLAVLTRENRKLRETLDRQHNSRAGAKPDDDAALREQIGELAAEVVRLTAKLEGPDSQIGKALDAPVPKKRADKAAPVSLAERIRALQEGKAAPPTG